MPSHKVILTPHPKEAQWLGMVKNWQVLVGKPGAQMQTFLERYLDGTPIDALILFGIAGSTGETPIGALFQTKEIRWKNDLIFKPTLPLPFPALVFQTVDKPVWQGEERNEWKEKGVAGVEMEGVFIARYCEQRDIRWNMVRVVADNRTIQPPFPFSPSFDKLFRSSAYIFRVKLEEVIDDLI